MNAKRHKDHLKADMPPPRKPPGRGAAAAGGDDDSKGKVVRISLPPKPARIEIIATKPKH